MQPKEPIELLQLRLDVELLFQQTLALKLYRLASTNLPLSDQPQSQKTLTTVNQ